ncbi:hypothetical protein CS8_086090 [Cupriavidus sp. 8B]
MGARIVDSLNRGQAPYALSGADAVFKTLAIEKRDTDWTAEDMAPNTSYLRGPSGAHLSAWSRR